MKLIDYEELMKNIEQDLEVEVTGRENARAVKVMMKDIYSDVKNSPIVVDLIRCRECTWYGIEELKKDGSVDERFKPSFCYLWRSEMDAEGYCSYAKREL